ncbi:MAG: PEP-CTERM sorting domain-containing protein [Burkholderiaceae bacterium]|nr:PEP-CTERM sorting domain-containing protein [Burkholderiaceae bacterium]
MSKLLSLAIALCAAAPASASNLVSNGSFETPNIVGGSYVLYSTGSTAITGWTVLGLANDSIQLTPDTYLGLKADDARQWIDLTGITGYDKGVKSDAIATQIGAVYHLSFAVGNYLPFGASTLGVSLNGGPEQLFTNTSLAATATNPMNWATFGFDWVADSTSTRISFLGRANGALSNNLGIGLDSVALTLQPVPEPQTWALLAAGLLALTGLRRRLQA